MKNSHKRPSFARLGPAGAAGILAACLLGAAASPCSAADTQATAKARAQDSTIRKPASRSFRFLYAGAVDQLRPGQSARVWLPVAQSDEHQQVQLVRVDVPGQWKIAQEAKYGNRVLYFQAQANPAGQIPFEMEYRVKRFELTSANREPLQATQKEQFLTAARMIPLDDRLYQVLVGEEPNTETDVLRAARRVYDAVDARMKYDKPAGGAWGRGDAAWACDSRYGNCTDFHSLFISVCRSQGIPARFEIGFPISSDRAEGEVGGYHCWARFAADGQWIPVDISEADKDPAKKEYYFGNLTPDRVTFSIGRDLQLEPRQAAGPVNFLIYPYVEVDGKEHAALQKRFRYADLP